MGDQTPSLTPGKPEPNLFPGNPTNPSPGRRLTDDPFAGYVHAIVGGVKAAPEDGVKNPPENLPCKKKPCDDSEEGGKGEPADLRKAASDWVRAQMDAPPTSHRAYYRERQNPRSHTDLSWKDWCGTLRHSPLPSLLPPRLPSAPPSSQPHTTSLGTLVTLRSAGTT